MLYAKLEEERKSIALLTGSIKKAEKRSKNESKRK